MRRHQVLPTFFAAMAVLGIGTAVLVDGPTLPRAVALPPTTVTTTTSAAPPTTTTTPAALVAALEGVWATTPSPATSCLVVQQRGRVVFERNPDVPLIPASTTKLLTALAASDRLALDEQLVTEVVASAPIVDGVVDGDLRLTGDDPVLGSASWATTLPRPPRTTTSLDALADRVVAAGVREVRGRVVGDVRVDDGRDEGAAVLTSLLRDRGVTVAGAPPAFWSASARETAHGSRPERPAAAAGGPIASIASAPLSEIVADMVRASDNETAEWLVSRVGGPTAVRDALLARGLPLDGVVIVDGSGRDRRDRLTCRLLVAVLTSLDRDGAVAAGLATAGRTGTLDDRFVAPPLAGRVRAKTGTIRGVAGLAGYASGHRGELVFAQVLNGTSERDARALQEALAVALVSA